MGDILFYIKNINFFLALLYNVLIHIMQYNEIRFVMVKYVKKRVCI